MPIITALVSQIKSYWQKNKPWIIHHVLWPFALTRLLLFVVGWFSQYFTPSANYFPDSVSPRPWAITPIRWLDIWARWDSGWYLDIVQHGYQVPQVSHQLQASSIAFWPLYPYLIRIISFLIPSPFVSPQLLLTIGVILSNIFLVLALTVIYHLILKLGHRSQVAQLAVWYLLLFPTSFIFSSFYTESLFLLLSAGAILLALNHRWLPAGLTGGLAAITRPYGVLILIPVFIIALESTGWQLKKWRQLFWVSFLPMTILGLYLSYAYYLTGDFLAPLSSHSSWNLGFAWPWQTIFDPGDFIGYITSLNQFLAVIFVILAASAWRWLPKSLSSYSILLIAVPLFSDALLSITRVLSIIFPLFILLAIWGSRSTKLSQIIMYGFLTIQVLLFAAWCQFYWIS